MSSSASEPSRVDEPVMNLAVTGDGHAPYGFSVLPASISARARYLAEIGDARAGLP